MVSGVAFVREISAKIKKRSPVRILYLLWGVTRNWGQLTLLRWQRTQRNRKEKRENTEGK
jgi:hypothetical protein